MIVADAAPVIAFTRLGRLALLQHIVEELVVPEAVYDDLVVKGRGKPGAAEVAESTWIRRESIRNRDATGHFPPVLGVGEREGHVLLGKQQRQRVLLAQPLDRLGKKTEDDRRQAQRRRRTRLCAGRTCTSAPQGPSPPLP